MVDTFNLDIDKIAENAIIRADETTEIIVSSDTSSTGQASFYDKLSPEQQSAIIAKASALIDNSIADQNALLDFGTSAVEEVNTTVNRILSKQKKLEIPQVNELLKNTNRELNGFIAKYEDAKPAELEKKPNFLQKLFKQGKDTLQEFYFDSQSTEQKMDGMAAAVVKQEETLARNIVSAEMLIEGNNKSIESLVGVIAFIEAAQTEGANRANQLQNEIATPDSTTPEY